MPGVSGVSSKFLISIILSRFSKRGMEWFPSRDAGFFIEERNLRRWGRMAALTPPSLCLRRKLHDIERSRSLKSKEIVLRFSVMAEVPTEL